MVSGGAGFIGSALVDRLLETAGRRVLTVDKMTYAATPASLERARANPNHQFLQADIADAAAMRHAFASFEPDLVFDLAAETHVDRSISGPMPFVQTNVVGVATLLETAHAYYERLPQATRDAFRFVHISTDEVFGALSESGAFTEDTAYAPNSPYSASKAAGDHLVRAWWKTYGLPALITNCSNNYGPRQFPEKLIPLMIVSALNGRPLPVYGDGSNVRDWIYVEDHVDGLIAAAKHGEVGERYLFGGRSEVRNLDLVRSICRELEAIRPSGGRYETQIAFVEDRKGHDFRYAVDDTHTRTRLGWAPQHDLADGLKRTIKWYLDNESWWKPLLEQTDVPKPPQGRLP